MIKTCTDVSEAAVLSLNLIRPFSLAKSKQFLTHAAAAVKQNYLTGDSLFVSPTSHRYATVEKKKILRRKATPTVSPVWCYARAKLTRVCQAFLANR